MSSEHPSKDCPERRMATAYCGQCMVFFVSECPGCKHKAAGSPPAVSDDPLSLIDWIEQHANEA